MKVNDRLLKHVEDRVKEFANHNRLMHWVENVNVHGDMITLISFAPNKFIGAREYSINWTEATTTSISSALAPIFRDVLKHFGCTSTSNTTGTMPRIAKVIFNNPATIVCWEDGTKTVVKCQPDNTYSEETGLAMAIVKKALGTNKSGSNYYDIFKKWLPKEEDKE